MSVVATRLERLLDRDSWEPIEAGPASGYVTVRGRIDGRPVYVSAGDPAPARCRPLCTVRQQIRFWEAVADRPAPVVLLLDAPPLSLTGSGQTALPPDAAELQASPQGVGRMYALQARLRGVVPQVAVLLGQLGASHSFPLALADTVVMLSSGAACLGRPDAVRLMIGQTTDFPRLGGAAMHCSVSGLGDVLLETESQCLDWTRRYLSYFPSRCGEVAPSDAALPPGEPESFWDKLVIPDPCQPFDMMRLVTAIVDQGSLCELQARYAREAITALGRIDGRPVGIVANNARFRGGILFPETCRKMAAFLARCDAFGIPLLFLADNPGFMVGEQVEHAGIIEAGAELFTAIARCAVPRVCLVVRRAYTAGLYAMAGPGFEPQQFLALPSASIAVFGKKALERFAGEPEMTSQGRRLIQEQSDLVDDPHRLRDKGLLDEVIRGVEIRPRLAAFLETAGKAPTAAALV